MDLVTYRMNFGLVRWLNVDRRFFVQFDLLFDLMNYLIWDVVDDSVISAKYLIFLLDSRVYFRICICRHQTYKFLLEFKWANVSYFILLTNFTNPQKHVCLKVNIVNKNMISEKYLFQVHCFVVKHVLAFRFITFPIAKMCSKIYDTLVTTYTNHLSLFYII